MFRTKAILANFLAGASPFRKVVDWLRERGSPIFMFHRILPEGETSYHPEMVTSTKRFAAFLDWVTDRYRVVGLSELVGRLGQPMNGKNPLCAITFDDGWHDNFIHAFPLLKERQLPVTVFLPVRFIGTDRRFWQERLYFCLQAPDKTHEAEAKLESVVRAFPWCPPIEPSDANYERLRQMLMRRPSEEAEEFVLRLEEATGALSARAGRAFLNWDEVRMMHDAGIAFGSHTLEHTLLTRTDPATAEREILDSRRELAERLGAAPEGFSYPWGAVGPFSRAQVEEAGYGFAVTIQGRLVRGSIDPWTLPRLAISDSFLRGMDAEFAPNRLSFYIASRALRRLTANGRQRPERVRLGFVIDSIDAWEDGGTEQQLRKLRGVLDRRYFEPELYFLRPPTQLRIEDFPCPVHLASSRTDGKWSRIGVVLRLARLFHQRRPHIVQTFFRDGTYYGTVAAWAARLPAIVICRRNAGHWKTSIDRLVLRVINRLADAWQCNSRTALESLTAEGVPAGRIDILPNALDLERFSASAPEERLGARQALALSPTAPVFVSVATLFPVKDPMVLVEAAGHVRQALPDAQFLLVGEGPLRISLASRIRELGLTANVRLAGAWSDVRPFLAAADIGLLTSRSEGSSNSLLEYMGVGLPSVVSDLPANRDLVNGVFFEPGNARELSSRVLSLWQDPKQRTRMSVDYRSRAMEYGLTAFTHRAQSYYSMLAAERPRSEEWL